MANKKAIEEYAATTAQATVAEILDLAHETQDRGLVARIERLFRLIQDSVGVEFIEQSTNLDADAAEDDLPF